jgi:uncharacterized protein
MTSRILRHLLNAAGSFFLVSIYFAFPASSYAITPESGFPSIPENITGGRAGKAFALGYAYFTGHGVPQDMKQAAYWYEKAAGYGDPVAQNQIGYFYQIGLGVKSDPARAVHWYQLAASSGFTNAKVNLAVAYAWGTGVDQNPTLAEHLFLEAASKGDSMGFTFAGDMYFLGEGVEKDQAKAEGYYKRAIKMHNYLADYRMGIILSKPIGHQQDNKRALSLLRESASAGFVPAMHAAGLLLVTNPNICNCAKDALALLEESANAGTWKSSFVLGTLARDGKLVPQDSRRAYLQFRIAVLEGGKTADDLLKNDFDNLSGTISPEDRAAIDEEAQEWAKKHSPPLEFLYKNGKADALPPAYALAVPEGGVHAGAIVPFPQL